MIYLKFFSEAMFDEQLVAFFANLLGYCQVYLSFFKEERQCLLQTYHVEAMDGKKIQHFFIKLDNEMLDSPKLGDHSNLIMKYLLRTYKKKFTNIEKTELKSTKAIVMWLCYYAVRNPLNQHKIKLILSEQKDYMLARKIVASPKKTSFVLVKNH